MATLREDLIRQIPTTGYPVAPDGNRIDSTELGRNISNTLSAAAPVLGGIGRGVNAALSMRPAAQVASGAGSAIAAYGVPAAGALGLAAGANADRPAAAAPERVAPGAAAPIASGVAGTSESNPSNTLRNNIVRQGNSYSSGDGGPITAGATINGQEGRGGFMVAGNGNSGIPAAPVSLRGAMPGSNDGGRWNGAMYRTGDQLRRDAEVQASSILPGTRRQGEQALAAQYRQEGIETEAASRMGAAAIGAESARYGADQRLRGDIFQSQGQRASAQAKLQMDAMQNDRQFGLDVARLGQAGAKQAFDQRQASEKTVVDRLTTLNTRTVDNKPVVDNEAVARQRGAIQEYLNTQIAAAERAGDKKTADELRQGGMASISEDKMSTLVKQLKLQDISRAETSNINPRAGTHVESAPNGYTIRSREDRLLRPDMYVLDNGARVPVNAVDRPGHTLGWGGTRSTEFDQLKRLRDSQ